MASLPSWALNSHPRIWLSSTLLTTLVAKKNANTADWVALKAQADTLKTYTVDAFTSSGCPNNHICYDYEGAGWFTSVLPLALVYQTTCAAGSCDNSYAAQAALILDQMNAPYKNTSSIQPITIDSGYPTRFVLPALAVAFDWMYSYISSTEKTDTVNTINAYYAWFIGGSPPFNWNGPDYGNYFGGHMMGFGLAADATDGDNSSSTTIYTEIKSLFDLNMGYGLQSLPVTVFPYSGGYYTSSGYLGGAIPESYNYGPNQSVRLYQLILGWKTSGRVDLTSTYTSWWKSSAKNLIYQLRGNLWQVGDEGDMPGNCTGVLNGTLPLLSAYLLSGSTEGAYVEYLFDHMVTNPCESDLTPPAVTDNFLWSDSTRVSTNYNTFQTSYMSPGDGHLLARSGWGSSDVFLSFDAGASQFPYGHQNFTYGNLEIQRGSDYLLAGVNQWKGTTGYSGTPYNFATDGQYASTLYFDDGGAYDYAGSPYIGGQFWWGAANVLASRTDANVAYALGDLGTGYDIRPDSRVPANRTARFVYRGVAYMGGNTVFVWDRFRSKSSAYTKRLQWHLPQVNAPSVAGSVISTVVGSSKLYLDVLLPASPTITTARDIATSDGTSNLTYNMQVSDSVTGTDLYGLTVAYATTSGGSLPTTTLLSTIDANWVGAQVQDSTPLVSVFAKTVQDNGNNTYTPLTYTSTSFTTTHTGTAKYLIAGLTAGTYNVTGNCVTNCAGQAVGSDGTLYFTGTSGAYSIAQGGAPVAASTINGQQLRSGQALGH